MKLDNLRIVLVRTQIAANLGSAARVMRNFGVSDLVLVDPIASPTDPNAHHVSTHGEAILENCRIVPDLEQAVGDCALVAATSAREGGLFRRQSAGYLEDLAPKVIEALPRGPIALVFGPERTGLTNAEISRCQWLLHIPTDAGYPALNLAQAVSISLYEIYRQSLAVTSPTASSATSASFGEQERMFAHLRESLEKLHFLYGDKADALWHGLRHMLTRANMTPMEVNLLHGLARQISWHVGNKVTPPTPPETDEARTA